MEIKNAFKQVYNKNSSYYLTIFFAVLMYSLNALFHNYKILFSQFSIKLIFSLIVGFHHTISIIAFISLILISLLSGIVITISIFLIRKQISGGKATGSVGVLVSLLAPACPSCALGLFGIVGIGSFLAFLPFGGMEMGVFGIVVLLLSLGFLIKKINTNICEIN